MGLDRQGLAGVVTIIMSSMIQLLCDLSEASDAVFQRAAIDDDRLSYFEELRRVGAIEAGPRPETVTCNACDADHPAAIEYDADRGCYTHFCPEAGIVALNDADLATYQFRPQWLTEWLGSALPIVSPVRRPPLIREHVWHLGDTTCGDTLITVIVARRVSNLAALDQLASVLHPVHRADRGVVITTSLHASRRVPLPGGYEFLPLPEIVSEGADGVVLDGPRFASWIGGMQRTTAKGAPTRIGRPTQKDWVVYIYRLRRERGVPYVSGLSEANAIRSEWKQHASGQNRPGASTIRTHLAELKTANQL